jgi:hypothetical protein
MRARLPEGINRIPCTWLKHTFQMMVNRRTATFSVCSVVLAKERRQFSAAAMVENYRQSTLVALNTVGVIVPMLMSVRFIYSKVSRMK